jgi:hypothetical protein
MNNAEHEAYVFASELHERERNARLAFTQTLRERLEAERVPIGALMESEEPEAGRGGQQLMPPARTTT